MLKDERQPLFVRRFQSRKDIYTFRPLLIEYKVSSRLDFRPILPDGQRQFLFLICSLETK